MKKFLIITFFLFSINNANAACDFIINIGDKGTKLYEKFGLPMPISKGQFLLPIPSTELCPNDNLGIDTIVEYVFLGKEDDDEDIEENIKNANLALIRMIVFNDENNTESNFFVNRANKTKMVNIRSKFNQFVFHLSNPFNILLRDIFLKRLVKNKKFLESYIGRIYR